MSFLNVFRYKVAFFKTTLDSASSGAAQPICQGAFSEISGLEASMDAHKIPEGGRNWGEIQRVGKTSFSTLVLKRGMTENRDLWTWFHGVTTGAYGYRLNAQLAMFDSHGDMDKTAPLLTWEFANCLPVKLKAADLSAKSPEIGIEELHLAHEGMSLKPEGGA